MKLIVINRKNPFFVPEAAANRLRSLIEGLQKKEVEIEILITEGYQNIFERQKMGINGVYKNIAYTYLSTTLLNTIWKRRFHIYIGIFYQKYSLSRKIKKYVRSDKIIWVSNDVNIWKLLHNIKKNNPEVKLFCEVSEFLDIHHYNKGNFLHRVNGDKRQSFFENKFLGNLNGLALMTKTLMNHYKKFENKPALFHLPMTVDLDRFVKVPEKLNEFGSPYIAFVGVMNNAKDGVDILIKSFAKLSHRFPKYKLYLVGPWNYDTPNHIRLIRLLNLDERVEWKGAYERDKIPNIIQNADLLVLPRPNSKQAQGGFPTKLGEYLATGVPVCATTVGEIPDYLEDNKSVFFAQPNSITSFTEAMERALEDKEQAQRIGKEGRKVAEKHFNKDIQTELLYNFLMQINNEDSK